MKFMIAFALALVMATGAVEVASTAVPSDSSELRQAVTAEGILTHKQALQAIADQNGGTRAPGMPGFDAQADYVAGKREAAGYNVTRQKFPFAFFQETGPSTFERTSPDPEAYERGTDYGVTEHSGSGAVTANLVPMNDIIIPPSAEPSSASGCEASDFPAETAGNIALVQRGTCAVSVKAQRTPSRPAPRHTCSTPSPGPRRRPTAPTGERPRAPATKGASDMTFEGSHARK